MTRVKSPMIATALQGGYGKAHLRAAASRLVDKGEIEPRLSRFYVLGKAPGLQAVVKPA